MPGGGDTHRPDRIWSLAGSVLMHGAFAAVLALLAGIPVPKRPPAAVAVEFVSEKTFEFAVGGPIPESDWEALFLPADC